MVLKTILIEHGAMLLVFWGLLIELGVTVTSMAIQIQYQNFVWMPKIYFFKLLKMSTNYFHITSTPLCSEYIEIMNR